MNQPQPQKRQTPTNKNKDKQARSPPFPLHHHVPKNAVSINDETRTFQEGFTSVCHILENCNNIVVLAGAGISVSCGIPDFRSKDGIYSTIDIQELGVTSPEDVFDLETFLSNPNAFYKFAQTFMFSHTNTAPSKTHDFLASLEQKHKLLRIYTQNIDGLEEKAGISSSKIVYAHGCLGTIECMQCGTRVDKDVIRGDVLSGKVPCCKEMVRPVVSNRKRKVQKVACTPSTTTRRPRRQLQQTNINYNEQNVNTHSTTTTMCTDDDVQYCGGLMKPCITFFGEKLLDKVGRTLQSDSKKVDAILVIGTSLSVAPMNKVIQYLPSSIPRFLINRDIVQVPTTLSLPNTNRNDPDIGSSTNEFIRNGYIFDAYLLGNCDDVVHAVSSQMEVVHAPRNKMEYSTQSSDLGKIVPNEQIRTYATTISSQKDNHKNRNITTSILKRTFLFQGADEILTNTIPNTNQKYNPTNHTIHHDNTTTNKEVVHCDECENEIRKTKESIILMKCNDCFDYDLCMDCYFLSKSSKKHFNGLHSFRKECIM